MNIKEDTQVLSNIIKNSNKHHLTNSQLAHLKEIESFLIRTFFKNPGRKIPNDPIKIQISELRRLKDEGVPSLILYIMQYQNEPTHFKSLREYFIKHNLLSKSRKVTAVIASSLNSLINSGKVERVSYGSYKLTEIGRKYIC